MSSVNVHPQKYRLSAIQPLDRHLSEIGEFDGTIYINAGIDSTCCNKRSQMTHKLSDGVVVSTSSMSITNKRSSGELNEDLSSELSNNTSREDDRFDSMKNSGCTQCGK